METIHQIARNYPLKVNFAGLKGNVAEMQKNGWEISLETQVCHEKAGYNLRVAGIHRNIRLQLISGIAYIGYRDMTEAQYFFSALDKIEMPVAAIGSQVIFNVNEKPNFKAADFINDFALVPFNNNSIGRFSLEECGVFRVFGNETEIYLPQNKILDVQEYLQDILKTQEPKQAQIRKQIIGSQGITSDYFKNEISSAPKIRIIGAA